jgi:hypothetical protein
MHGVQSNYRSLRMLYSEDVAVYAISLSYIIQQNSVIRLVKLLFCFHFSYAAPLYR